MAIRDTILALKNKEGTLTNNKVCNFAYDDTAFEDDTTAGANGVINYNYNNHNNIPVKDNEVIKVNPTITSKGFRSQVSTLPRMLLNHIFGRVSYNLNKTVDTLNATLQALYNAIGQANGIATLDNTGRLPYSQLPLSAVEYKGAWNAETNTPALSSGSGTFGDEYIVSVQGTRNLGEGSVTYRVGDHVIYNGSVWQRIPSSSVRSVNTKTPDANGNVTVNAEDMTTPDVYGYDRASLGKVWTEAGSFDYARCVYFANGIWVFGYKNGLCWSTDGIHWNAGLSLSNSYFDCVYYADGIWVAGGALGLYWSTDGKNWTLGDNSINAWCIYYANGLWVAGSYYLQPSGLYWSTDGKTWTQGTGTTRGFTSICYANGIWVAGSSETSSQAFFFWSIDGKSWTQGTLITSGSIWCIHYANGIFVAGTSNSLYWSTDGQTWTQGTGATTGALSNSIYYANGIWVAGVFWSTDGKNWTRGTGGGADIKGVYYASGLWVAGGYFWSTDGKNWTRSEFGSAGYSWAVYFANGVWVSVTDRIGVYYSVGTRSNNVKAILDWLIYAVDNLLD